MMKRTCYPLAYVTLLLWPVLLFSVSGRANLVNYGRNAKEIAHLSGPLLFLPDTIPVEERENFDKAFGSSEYQYQPHSPVPFAEKENTEPMIFQPQKVEVGDFQPRLYKVPDAYSGFKIEIMRAREPLPASHDIFFQHGKLFAEKLQNNTLSYMLGDFPSADEANAFLSGFLAQRYPDAQVVEYREGERY